MLRVTPATICCRAVWPPRPRRARCVWSSRARIIAERRAKELADAQALAAKLGEAEISIQMQATEDEQLFGSVTPRMIAEELGKQGFAVEHSRVKLDPPIKMLGEYEVEIKLHADVTAKVKVWVVRG